MRAVLLVVLALACGCERDEAWDMRLRLPRAGDHSTSTTSYTSELVGPDGRHHHGRYAATIALDVIEASVDGIGRAQATVLDYVHTLDGAPFTQLAPGRYQLVRAPGTDHLTVEHGDAAARELFERMKAITDVSALATFNRQQYRTGNTFTVPGSVLRALHLTDATRASTAIVTVEHADAASVVLRTAYDAPGEPSQPDLHVTATIRISRLGVRTSFHTALSYRGAPAGSVDGESVVSSLFP